MILTARQQLDWYLLFLSKTIKCEFSSDLPSEFILTGLKHATFKSILFEISKDRRIFYVYHYANCESPHINIGG